MEITQTLYVQSAQAWRAWLEKHHATAREIWLVYYKKTSGKPRIPYNDAVDQALCFGWIDSLTKTIDGDRWAQRFTPRRPGSPLSEMNKARVRRLIREKQMTTAGLEALESALRGGTKVHEGKIRETKRWTVPPDILARRTPRPGNTFSGCPWPTSGSGLPGFTPPGGARRSSGPAWPISSR